MKIIICGAGQVGETIASHLAEEDNDVTIIDQNQERLRRVLDHSDVSGVEGLASYPEVLQKAGVEEAIKKQVPEINGIYAVNGTN